MAQLLSLDAKLFMGTCHPIPRPPRLPKWQGSLRLILHEALSQGQGLLDRIQFHLPRSRDPETRLLLKVGGIPTPLKFIGLDVSWDEEIPNGRMVPTVPKHPVVMDDSMTMTTGDLPF